MIHVALSLFPEGRPKAVTLSYDDGTEHDRHLISLLDLYGIRGTFHLNSGTLGKEGFLESGEVKELFTNHEVAVHTVNHPFVEYIPQARFINEILEDRRVLEALVGYPVRGMSYPFGTYNAEVIRMLPDLGIRYSRTVESTGNFWLTNNFFEWHPTCHHSNNLLDKVVQFKNLNPRAGRPALFYVWGHSYEFAKFDNWDLIEEFCQEISHDDEIWYATNIEIVDYITALKRLEFSADNTLVKNPNGIPVWILVNDSPHKLEPNTITDLRIEPSASPKV